VRLVQAGFNLKTTGQALLNHESVTLIAKAMKNHDRSVSKYNVLYYGCHVLSHIINHADLNPEMKSSVVAQGGAEAIMHEMSKPLNSHEVQQIGLAGLQTLMMPRQDVLKLLAKQVLTCVTGALHAWNMPEIKKIGCYILVTILDSVRHPA
jgi:hypothetical protein